MDNTEKNEMRHKHCHHAWGGGDKNPQQLNYGHVKGNVGGR